MAAENRTRFTTPRLVAPADGATEASVLQAFLVHLERKGLLQSEPSHARRAARDADAPVQASAPADIENAVRKLIAALKEPS
jgi:hypothetical protein